MLVECFEPQGRHLTNIYYYYYYYGTYIDTLTFSASGSLFFLIPRMSAPPNSDTPPIGFFFPLKQETSSVLWQEQETTVCYDRNQLCVVWQKLETSSVCYTETGNQFYVLWQKQEAVLCYGRNQKPVQCVMTEIGNQFCVLWQKEKVGSVCYGRNQKPVECYDRNRKPVQCVMTETGKQFCVL